MTLAPAALSGLAPLETALAVVRRRRGPAGTAGLLPGLVATPPEGDGWFPASDVVSGAVLDALLDAAARRWRADRHVAAALAWRSYTYWLAMPAVLGWATARRVPLLHPTDVSIRLNEHGPFLTISLRRVRLAILSEDPLSPCGSYRSRTEMDLTAPAGGVDQHPDGPGTDAPDIVPVESEWHLLRTLRQSLRTEHLDPLLVQIQARARLSERALLGSLASAVGNAAVRGLDAPPEQVIAAADQVLTALDVADLVSIIPAGSETLGSETLGSETLSSEALASDTPGGGATNSAAPFERYATVNKQPRVQRNTCCLAFRLPEPKICSGCCLRR
jgi:hypothetical protein